MSPYNTCIYMHILFLDYKIKEAHNTAGVEQLLIYYTTILTVWLEFRFSKVMFGKFMSF